MRIVTLKSVPHDSIEEQIKYFAYVIVEIDWIDKMDDVHEDTVYYGPILAFEFEKSTKHEVLVVGFGTKMVGNEEVRFWIIQNSHGCEWRNNIFFRFNQAKIHNRYLVNNAQTTLGISYSSSEEQSYLRVT
ncbi:cathepsin B [Trifolium repens]|nr:cathepsin B [Trifolium repens]